MLWLQKQRKGDGEECGSGKRQRNTCRIHERERTCKRMALDGHWMEQKQTRIILFRVLVAGNDLHRG